ncbi:IS30 family transposase [Salicibibacter cibarius]|uniref:IS30 family transposase n=1 Tax=Salicibibacter cibarius TaxID=2743000 RepID=A0A7T6Z0M8_9BACI|nr:IS30 family transposase [Salicibibacter cibarius]QQK74526.1 IS30 family transposase [Salicibibacter cibarius]
MANTDSNTTRRTFSHLSETERGEFSAYLTMGLSLRAIAKKMDRHVSTLSREKKRGTVQQMDTNRISYKKYYPDAGARVYEAHRQNSGCPSVRPKASAFLAFAEKKILKDKWSPDVLVGYARKCPEWQSTYIPCAKTLYNWIDAGQLTVINMDLPLKLRRSTKKKRSRENKRVYGTSIDERCPSVDTRETFGHWEIDTVIGKKSNDEALLTLVERQTRKELMVRLEEKNAPSVEKGLNAILAPYQKNLTSVFKTITADNGSEFSELDTLGQKEGISIYFSHPFASYERGSNERHNGLIRRFIKKGEAIHSYTDEKLQDVEKWMNSLPRKILGYETPDDVFARALSGAG